MLSKATPKHGLGKGSNFNPKVTYYVLQFIFKKRSFMTSKNRGKKSVMGT